MNEYSFQMGEALCNELEKHNFYFWKSAEEKHKVIGRLFTFAPDVRYSQFASIREGTELLSIGRYTYVWSAFPRGTTIGAYCSIAKDSEAMASNHPFERFTTSPITYDGVPAQFAAVARHNQIAQIPNPHMPIPPTIGNDVWIGSGCLFGRGVKIGDGAVIGARSVVTKDVPPYHVVAGTPARTIRLRFPEKQIERMLSLRWFDYDIIDLECKDPSDIDGFMDAFEEARDRGTIRKLQQPPLFADVLQLMIKNIRDRQTGQG